MRKRWPCKPSSRPFQFQVCKQKNGKALHLQARNVQALDVQNHLQSNPLPTMTLPCVFCSPEVHLNMPSSISFGFPDLNPTGFTFDPDFSGRFGRWFLSSLHCSKFHKASRVCQLDRDLERKTRGNIRRIDYSCWPCTIPCQIENMNFWSLAQSFKKGTSMHWQDVCVLLMLQSLTPGSIHDPKLPFFEKPASPLPSSIPNTPSRAPLTYTPHPLHHPPTVLHRHGPQPKHPRLHHRLSEQLSPIPGANPQLLTCISHAVVLALEGGLALGLDVMSVELPGAVDGPVAEVAGTV